MILAKAMVYRPEIENAIVTPAAKLSKSLKNSCLTVAKSTFSELFCPEMGRAVRNRAADQADVPAVFAALASKKLETRRLNFAGRSK